MRFVVKGEVSDAVSQTRQTCCLIANEKAIIVNVYKHVQQKWSTDRYKSKTALKPLQNFMIKGYRLNIYQLNTKYYRLK